MELVLSILFSLQLTISWRTITSVFLSPGSGGWLQGGVPSVTFAVAIALLLVQLALAVHFYRRVVAYRRGSERSNWLVPRRPWSYRSDHQVKPNDLQQAVDFLIMRFTTDAPRWQLVIWLRQLTLSLLLFCVDLFAYSLDDNQSASRYVFASVAVVIMLVWWRLHARTRPFFFNAQNAMESWFYGCNVVILLLAMAYTAVLEHVKSKPLLLALEITLGWSSSAASSSSSSTLFTTIAASGDPSQASISRGGVRHHQAEDRQTGDGAGSGSIHLLRCSWLLSDEADNVLRQDTEDHGSW